MVTLLYFFKIYTHKKRLKSGRQCLPQGHHPRLRILFGISRQNLIEYREHSPLHTICFQTFITHLAFFEQYLQY